MIANNLLNALGHKDNRVLVLDFKEWFLRTYPKADLAQFINSMFEHQLGIWIAFFEYRNYYILVTPNSYAIDNVNYEADQATLDAALLRQEKTGTSFVKRVTDLNKNDVLVIYEIALIDLIKITNGGIPF